MNSSSDPLLVIHNQIENLISRTGDEIYDELIKRGVLCSDCGNSLSDGDIRVHQYSGITNPDDMMCLSCWPTVYNETDIS